MTIEKLNEYRKFIVALLGVVAAVVAYQFVDETWTIAVVGALDAIAVALVPNALAKKRA